MIKFGLILKSKKELIEIIFRKDDIERQLRKQIKCLEKKIRELEKKLYLIKTEDIDVSNNDLLNGSVESLDENSQLG